MSPVCFDCLEPIAADDDDTVTFADGKVEHGTCVDQREEMYASLAAEGFTIWEYRNGAVALIPPHTEVPA